MSNQNPFYSLLDTLSGAAVQAGEFALSVAVQAGELALGAAGLAFEQAEKLAEAGRLRYQAARVEGELDEKLIEVGEMVYGTHTGTPSESEALLEKLREIDALKGELDGLNETLGRADRRRTCPACGAAAGEEDHYCRECGEKFEEKS